MARSVESPTRILMIEDCKSDVLLFQHSLGPIRQQCSFTHVSRLIDGFREIDNNLFDLIVLDLNLLDLDGLANVAALKAQCPFTPVIVYSGRNDARLQRESCQIGAAAYVVKGETSPQSLQETVSLALAS